MVPSQRGDSARLYRTGATSAPARRVEQASGRLGPASGLPAPAILVPPPGSSPGAPHSFPEPGGGRRRRGFGPGGNTPDITAAGAAERPCGCERAGPRRTRGAGGRPRDRAGGGDAVTCRGLRRFLPVPLSWPQRQRDEGREPKGPVTAPSVHRAPPRRRRRRGPSIPAPRALRACRRCCHSDLKWPFGKDRCFNRCFQISGTSPILTESLKG